MGWPTVCGYGTFLLAKPLIRIDGKKGPKPLRLVFVGERRGQHRHRAVAGAAVKFELVRPLPDDALEPERVRAFRHLDVEFGHHAQVVQDSSMSLRAP